MKSVNGIVHEGYFVPAPDGPHPIAVTGFDQNYQPVTTIIYTDGRVHLQASEGPVRLVAFYK